VSTAQNPVGLAPNIALRLRAAGTEAGPTPPRCGHESQRQQREGAGFQHSRFLERHAKRRLEAGGVLEIDKVYEDRVRVKRDPIGREADVRRNDVNRNDWIDGGENVEEAPAIEGAGREDDLARAGKAVVCRGSGL